MATVTYRNASIECVPNMANRGSVAVFGGHERTVAFSFNIRREHFRTVDEVDLTVDSEMILADSDLPRPKAGMTMSHRGHDYQIVSSALDPSRCYFNVALADKESGR